MRIAVIGPGSMGLLYGGKLSECADVTLIGNNEENIRLINENGVIIKRDDVSKHYTVKASKGVDIKEPFDLLIMFTKAYLTEAALEQNRELIEKNTYLLTLQNGAGHEAVLSKYVDEQIQRLENHLKNAPNGLTSIYSDLKNGRKTEVDYINGAVIRAAQKHKLAVPSHEMIVHLVHAMEGINR
jgi:ketopantoate reductase